MLWHLFFLSFFLVIIRVITSYNQLWLSYVFNRECVDGIGCGVCVT